MVTTDFLPPWRASLLLFVVALGIRLAVIAATFDVPGDGPSRAIAAVDWAQSPSFPMSGVWPPGFLFLSGSVEALVHDPRISSRLVNLVLGSLTVPVLYLLAVRLYGAAAGLASGCVLCILPLHVGLSASSLSEPAFLLEVAAATLLLIGAPAGQSRTDRSERLRLVLGAFCLVLASMTRYETWPLLPLFVVHRFVRTRSLRAAGVLAIALLAFPVAWTIGNYVQIGDPWAGFTAATSYIGIPPAPVGVMRATELLATWSESQLGWLLPAAMLFGTCRELVRAARRRIDSDQLLFLAIVGMQWLVLLRFTMVRGEWVWTRYLIAGLALGLPLAFVPWAGAPSGPASAGARTIFGRHRAALLAATAIVTLFLPWLGHPEKASGLWVTSRQPVAMDAVAEWLRNSGRLEQSILLTPMDWDATYVALRVPQIAKRSLILSEWIDDGLLRGWVHAYRPTLLVTRRGDESYAARIAAALHYELDDAHVLFLTDEVRVLDLRRPARAPS